MDLNEVRIWWLWQQIKCYFIECHVDAVSMDVAKMGSINILWMQVKHKLGCQTSKIFRYTIVFICFRWEFAAAGPGCVQSSGGSPRCVFQPFLEWKIFFRLSSSWLNSVLSLSGNGLSEYNIEEVFRESSNQV